MIFHNQKSFNNYKKILRIKKLEKNDSSKIMSKSVAFNLAYQSKIQNNRKRKLHQVHLIAQNTNLKIELLNINVSLFRVNRISI